MVAWRSITTPPNERFAASPSAEKDWLFCGGRETAAVHFSLIATCARHGVDPFGYLRTLYTRLPALLSAGGSPDELRDLLPDRWLT